MSRISHFSVSVSGLLANVGMHRQAMRSLLFDGKKATDIHDFRSKLVELLRSGVECLPIGQPCEGWSDATGCPGHDVPDTDEVVRAD